MKTNIARLARWLVVAGAGLLAAGAHAQQDLRIIHGSSAGAPQDVMLRVLADEMSKISGSRVLIEPTPGADGKISHAALMRTQADGRTLLAEGTGITSILQLPGREHEWSDFEPLYRVQLDPFALYSLPSRYPDLKAFVADLKAQPDKVRIGGWANGGPFHIISMQLAAEAKGKFDWIPYTSGGKAIVEMIGGNIEGAMSNISVYNTFKQRTVVLAHSGEARLPQFPEVPTLKELGYNIVRYHWRGLFIKKGTPDALIQKNYELVQAAVKSARFQTFLKDTATLDGTLTRGGFKDMLAKQAADDAVILKQIKLIP